jgi:putative glutamine amidotransferase
MSVPVIGVSTSRNATQVGFSTLYTAEAYVQALVQAGACPLLIPNGLPDDLLRACFSRLDGLLLTGGGDIDPVYYGAENHPKVTNVDPDRDRVELYLLGQAVQQGAPFLGICRGFQVVNVALGGALYADIAAQRPNALKHDFFEDWPRDHLAHEVQLRAGSRLAKILGEPVLWVNSLHHQGALDLAPGLQATAFAPDGLVEAVELPKHSFGLAVQWHPEWLTAYPPMRALFRAFVEAAGDARRAD